MKGMLHKWSARTVGRLLSARPRSRAVILCYHSVHPTASFSIRPHIFEDHLRWLSEHCDVVTFNEILPRNYENPRRPAVTITFDDGYADNYEVALPLLMKYRLTATFFLTAGFMLKSPAVIDRFAAGWHTQSSKIVPMTWPQTRELVAAGMQVGGHGYTHMALSTLDEMSAMADLSTSKKILEDALGASVLTMSYPYGRLRSAVKPETVRLATEAGYQRAALVLFRGVQPADSLMELPRFVADSDSVRIVREKVLGWWDPVGIWRERWVRFCSSVTINGTGRRLPP